MGRWFSWVVLGAACSAAAVACSDGQVSRPDISGGSSNGGSRPGNGGDGMGGASGGAGAIPDGQGVGEDCSEDNPCRDGLVCTDDELCEPGRSKQPGEACVISAECEDGQCLARMCAPAGELQEGESCQTDTDCAAGLRCNLAGLSLTCAPEGDGDVGAACGTSGECFGGLACLGGMCALAPPGLPPFGAPWAGVECEPPVEENVRAYFEVPGASGAQEGDFFRLPFPNDVRLKQGGGIDLTDFPTPGSALLGVDPVQLYVDAVSENDSGWGVYPTVFFRFSGMFDGESFSEETVHFVDITDPAQPRNKGWRRYYFTGRTNYLCENWVAIQPYFGSPLEPEHTYAVWIDNRLIGADGEPIERAENLSALLGSSTPADDVLAGAHAKYAGLRQYLEGENIDEETVLTATVFTVGAVRNTMKELSEAVQTLPVATAKDWVKCGAGVDSPCPQAEGGRACGEGTEDYDEYHALVSLPVFQQGTAPYLTAQDGGGIDVSSPSSEDVCLSLTVPTGDMPALGWPAVVFAHGTGGSFRGHVRDEVAGVLSRASEKFVVLGIDQVQHGPRRGDSMQSPNNLFFNFLNPAAARGNPLQGAADQLSLARFAATLEVSAETSGGAAIKIDGTRLVFFGHSQGATEGSLMLPYGDLYKAAVLSGNGASLQDSLRTKTSPENIAAALPFALQEPLMADPDYGPGVAQYHPVLALLQQWIDPADPLSYAPLLPAPPEGHVTKDVLQTFGSGDTFSTPVTLAMFAVAAGLDQVTPHESADPVYEEELPGAVALGLTGNVGSAQNAVTQGMRQYGPPAGEDGHFVVFDVPAASDDMVLFVTGAVGATPPIIGQ
jgi:predicted esterase